jgi:O-antigen/teichoic acid export membrane protein
MIGLPKVIENGGWLLSDKAARLVVGLLITAFIARYLGPGDFGIWSYTIALTTITGAFAGLGLDRVLTKALVETGPASASGTDPETPGIPTVAGAPGASLIPTALTMRLGASAGAGILSMTLVWFIQSHDPNRERYLECTGILSLGVLLQSLDVLEAFYLSRQQIYKAIIPKTGAFLLFSLVRIAFIHYRAGLLMFVWTSVAEIALAYTLVALRYAREQYQWNAPSMAWVKDLWGQSWPLLLANLSILIYMKVDQLLLEGMTNATQLGEYVAATRLSELWYALPMTAASALLPALVLQRKEDPLGYRRSVQHWIKVSLWVSAGLSVIVTFLAEPLSHLLFGNAYPETGKVLQIHIWSGVPVFLCIVFTQHLIIEGRYAQTLYASLIGIAVNVGLNLWWIPLYGAIGAALATVISYGAVLTVLAIRSGPALREQLGLIAATLAPRIRYNAWAYSSEGEDMILKRIFHGRTQGVYVDVGAHHPFRYSNTYMFYRLRWSGINIDPNPGSKILFDRYRPRDTNLELGVSANRQRLTYHVFNETALNTFSPQTALDYENSSPHYKVIGHQEIQTLPLSEILDQHLGKLNPSCRIDFLTIDAEGLDLEVLSSNNWDKYRPDYVLVEGSPFDLPDIGQNPTYAFMKEKGYDIFAKTYYTYFFKNMNK